MIWTLLILGALVALGLTNWVVMQFVAQEHEGVEAELDALKQQFEDSIQVMKIRKQ